MTPFSDVKEFINSRQGTLCSKTICIYIYIVMCIYIYIIIGVYVFVYIEGSISLNDSFLTSEDGVLITGRHYKCLELRNEC